MSHAAGELLPRRDVQELIRSVGVRARAQDSCDEELRLRVFLSQHPHEWNGPTFSHVRGFAAKKGLRRALYRLAEPGTQLRRIPTFGALVERVYPDTPAASAGLRPNDVILQLESVAVRDENHLINLDWYHPQYAHRHTEEEVRSWCAAAGVRIVHFDAQESGYTVRFVST